MSTEEQTMEQRIDTLFAALMAPFANEKTKPGGQGRPAFQYITARQAMNRLDEVVGPENWWDEYFPSGGDLILCKITIRLPDGTLLSKMDGGGHAGMSDGDDDEKSAISGAFKRAAVKFGVGRYLYRDGVPSFAGGHHEGHHAQTRQHQVVDHQQSNPQGGEAPRQYAVSYDCPKSGKALYAWMCERQNEFGLEVRDKVNSHPQIKGHFPARMTEWDDNQVAFGYGVMKKLWKDKGLWPEGAGNSPGEVEEPAGDKLSPATAPASGIDVDKLKAARGKIREIFEELVKVENPDVQKVKTPMLMDRINASGKKLGWPPMKVDEFIVFRDLGKLKALASVGRDELEEAKGGESGDGIPF